MRKSFSNLACYFYFILFFFSDLNPAAQGSSLTEGKRAKRSKKQGDVNGDRSGSPNSDEVDGEIEVPDPKTKKDDVRR